MHFCHGAALEKPQSREEKEASSLSFTNTLSNNYSSSSNNSRFGMNFLSYILPLGGNQEPEMETAQRLGLTPTRSRSQASTSARESASSRRSKRSSSSSSNKKRSKRDDPDEGTMEESLPESLAASRALQPTLSSGTLSPSDSAAAADEMIPRHYSISQLVACLGSGGQDASSLPPELERRVLDFRLAQSKRLEKYGETSRWGIFGMYAHLADVRTDLEWSEDAAYRRNNDEPYLSWSDFDALRHKGINRPWFTYFLVFICTVMLFVEFGVNGWKVEPLNVNPLIGPSAETLIQVGARDTTLIVEEGQWFRIFSPIILHAGLVHYVINIGALWFIGGAVEKSNGIWKAMLLFFLPGVGGNILSAVFLPQYITVGASGGIFGLIGGCLADITVNWNLLFLKDNESDDMTPRRNYWAIFWIVLEMVVNILLGLTPYIDNFTHLGGLIYGLCCGWSTIESVAAGFFGFKASFCTKLQSFLVRFFGVIVSVVFIMVTTAWLATSDVGNAPCPNCRYFSCVPFPWWTENKWWHCDDCDFVTADLFRRDGGEFYDRIELTCPDDSVANIDISSDQVANREVMRDRLPDYCRSYCDDVFAN